MIKNNFKAVGILILMYLVYFAPKSPRNKITVWLIGDSTVAVKKVSGYPETGWGMPFSDYFDSTVTVKDKAVNAPDIHTFIRENRWKAIESQLKEGDYVLIQYGGNDEVPYSKSYDPPKQFKAGLLKFVNETRAKKATPVLITPVTRRRFDSSGNAIEMHPAYSHFVKEVAAKNNVPLIDLDSMSRALEQKLGPQDSKFLWINISKGENPHYPDGRVDNGEFNEYGARKIAELVLKGIEKLHLDLANRIQFSGKRSKFGKD